MEEWSNAFYSFLTDTKYQDTKLKKHNLNNIYNLLFLPSYSEGRNLNMGQPPLLDNLILYMIENGKLMADGDDIMVTEG